MKARTRLLALAVCAFAGLGSTTTASAKTCSQQDRVDNLVAFSEAWSRGGISGMALDRPTPAMPFGLTLPKRQPRWPRELQRPLTRQLPSVKAWLRRRVAAGDRLTILRVNITGIHKGVTGGTLSFRRTSPDIRGGHKIYGVAKFGVRCGGVEGISSGRSWWTWTTAISVCHPGKLIGSVRFCGRLPK